ncbi:hypothetical protein GALMADRAFT_1134148 [Galerina marginata CBS 339.88]|uniref:F-box domain-containing protein n=1 Tax=Galerina marginata (strain CBS 339.88) TaxID=685588 RepID=A0A067S8B1_GALM3|nr:hypothetical protein GALMADRAFT_1134148 [Galerina marginata CBS 339.88]
MLDPTMEVTLKSPVPQLLTSNEEPSDDQINAVLEAIRLASEEISHQSVASHEARGRQVELATFICVHKAVLSPVRRISAEILQHIFAYLAHSSGPNFPLQLSVCRLWHGVAKCFPDLLSILPPLRLTRQTTRKEFIASLEARIARVPRSVLLSIDIADCISPSHDQVSKTQHPVTQTAYRHSKKWRSVTMSVDSNSLNDATAALKGRLPNLHCLKLHVPTATKWRTELQRSRAFSVVPLLRKVELDSPGPHPITFKNLPWLQLTTYKERTRCPVGLANVLLDHSAIEHVEYRTTDPISAPSLSRATLMRLQSLDFRIYGNALLHGSPVDSLTTPILRNIRIRDHSPLFLNTLIEFLSRSSPGSHLTRLSFHTTHLLSGELTKILLLSPALIELECNDIPFTDLCLLHTHSKKFTLVPYLQNLIIHSPTSLDEIEKLAQSRSRRTSTFSVRLVFTTRGLCNVAADQLTVSCDSLLETATSLSNVLTELDIILDECVANRTGKSVFGIWRSYSDRNVGRKLDNLVSVLETIPLEEMPEFYVWTQSVLRKFWALDYGLIPQERTYHLSDRVTGLIYLWRILFHARDIFPGFIRHGRFCLFYFKPPEDMPKSDVEWILLHGRNKIVDDKEVFWTNRDFSDSDSIYDYLKWRRMVGLGQ